MKNPPSPSEQNNVLVDVATRLENLGIGYMLTGSMALIHYAMPRSTTDIDIVIELNSNDADRLVNALYPDFYVVKESILNAIYYRRMFNILDQRSIIKVDLIILKDTEYHQLAFKRRIKVDYVKGQSIWISTKEDLILSKLIWAKRTRSEMQMRDVASILRNGYDINYVEEWAAKLEVLDILDDSRNLLSEQYAERYDT